MRILFLTAIIMGFLAPAFAATRSPQYSNNRNKGEILWEGITNGDTTGEAEINLDTGTNSRCGLYRFFVNGTTTGLDIELQAGKTSGALKSIDTGVMPDGATFDSTSTGNHALVCLCSGDKADISFTSSGTGDADLYLTPAGICW